MDRLISKKKPNYPLRSILDRYLLQYDRKVFFPIQYLDLKHFVSATPILDKNGKDTLWESVQYSQMDMQELYPALTKIYAILKTEGDTEVMEHLRVDSVDYCTFGNTKPFRVRIINNYNDNYDYFYVKTFDASRAYGLELEHILSPNRINYIVWGNTIIEEHIAGIPGDQFAQKQLLTEDLNKIRIAKEFIKFNERCFVRLLGDMRAYNFVIDVTPDFDAVQYRIRAIDFDQQSFEGKAEVYQPQFFKDNRAYVDICLEMLNKTTALQYKKEERALIAGRVKASRYRLKDLIDCMAEDTVSTPEKIKMLRERLAESYENKDFLRAETMGQVVKKSLQILIRKNRRILNRTSIV